MIELPLGVGAFAAGMLMFFAPCTLPIVPGYLAFIAGAGARRSRIFANALAFVAGFSVVFVLLGAFAGAAGALFGPVRPYLGPAAGLVIIIFGLTMLGILRLPFLSAERRPDISKFRYVEIGNKSTSGLLGALFALGWSPCIGPVLGTVLLFASGSSTAFDGAVLLAIFAAGLAAPFLLTALLLERAQKLFARFEALSNVLSRLGGVVLVLLGLLMLTGNTPLLVSRGYALFDFLGYERLLDYL